MGAGKTRKKINAKGSRSSGGGGGGSGTVTSVSETLGTAGTDIALTVTNPTTTPNIDLQIPTASATNRGALSSADWTTFNENIKRIVTITKATANTMQGSSTAVPGQWYKVTGAAGVPIVASEFNTVILIGDTNGKFNIQGWAEIITSKGNYYAQCKFGFDAGFDLLRPEGLSDLWIGKLTQVGTADPTIHMTILNNLHETPTLTYVGVGEYELETTGDHFKTTDIFIESHKIVKAADINFGDRPTFVTVSFSTSAKILIKTYQLDIGSGLSSLADDILNKTTIVLQRALTSA